MVACLSSIPSLSLREWRVVSASTATCSAYAHPTPIVYRTNSKRSSETLIARLVLKPCPNRHLGSSLAPLWGVNAYPESQSLQLLVLLSIRTRQPLRLFHNRLFLLFTVWGMRNLELVHWILFSFYLFIFLSNFEVVILGNLQRWPQVRWTGAGDIDNCIACCTGFGHWPDCIVGWHSLCWPFRYFCFGSDFGQSFLWAISVSYFPSIL
jgi:hypothetical protein